MNTIRPSAAQAALGLLGLVTAISFIPGVGAAATPARTAKVACAAMQGFSVPKDKIRLPTGGATVTSAKVVPAEGQPGTANYTPEYCELRGEIAPVDPNASKGTFGVAIPNNWNGNAIQIGGNGMLGFVPYLAGLNRDGAGSPSGPTYAPDKQYPLTLGYLTYGGDSGHGGAITGPGRPGGVPPTTGQATVGGAPPDAGARRGGGGGGGAGPANAAPPWAANRETWVNFGYEHIQKDHDTMDALVEHMYGARPRYSFYAGESHGGRQAAQAIARYPADYDGVLISVPLMYLTELFLMQTRNQLAQAAPGGWISVEKAKVVEGETMRQCDELDGLKDGLVLNYKRCTDLFDPVKNPNAMAAVRCPDGADSGPNCLSDAQIKTVTTVRSPIQLPYALASGARTYAGIPVGSEFTLNWPGRSAQAPVLQPEYTNGAVNFVRDMTGDRTLAIKGGFDLAPLASQLKQVSDDMDPPTDWSKFLAKGGKVIYHTASNDYTTNANAHIQMYEEVVAKLNPAARRNLKFYVTPSGDHGSRSYTFPERVAQPRYSDLLGTLTAWVEQKKTPPAALRQTLMDNTPPYAVSKSRPLCQYPNYPRYKGSGDPNQFDSYRCAAP